MKKRLIAFLLVLIMVLGMLPVSALAADDGISPQALNTGHKIDVRFTVLYVGDEFSIGYDYGASENTQFVCQYSTPHSDTAYTNHTIAISDIKAAADRASVKSGYQIVGWSKESNANPTVWPLNKAGTTACNKGTSIYLVAKDPNPQVTYTLTYDKNTTDNVTNMPETQTETNSKGYATFPLSGKIPVRNGYTFKSWQTSDGKTVAPNVTLTKGAPRMTIYAVWEKNTLPVPDKPLPPTEDDIRSNLWVTVVCTTNRPPHEKLAIALFAGDYTIADTVKGDAASGYTCEVTVQADKYIVEYGKGRYVENGIDLYYGSHRLVAGEPSSKVLTLIYANDTWTIPAKGEVNFNVECDNTPPSEIPGDQKPEFEKENAKIRVQCIEYPSKHNPYKQNYRILPGSYDDLGWDRTEYGYIYSIRLNRAKYIAQFDQEIGRPHTDTEPNEETRIDWRWENGAWHLIDGPDGVTADIKVKCAETPVEPKKPTALDGSFAIVCKNNEATHAHKADYIATPSQYTISDVQTDEQGYYVTATVTVAPNLAAYNNLTGAEHRLVNEQDATLTITFRYDTEVTVDGNRKWKQQGEVPVVEVICKPKAPTADDLKKLEMAVQVKCVVDASQQHTAAYGLLGEYDEDYFVFEPRQEGDDWLCDINYYPERYVAEFNTTFQNLKHVQNDEKIVPVTLIWAGDSWQIKEQGRVHVTEVYTVTYTDGVDGEEVFADQVYSDLRKDSTTPAFNGTPTRTGYTFAGWEPEVAATVTQTVTYVAKWEKKTYKVVAKLYVNGKPAYYQNEDFYTYKVSGLYGENIDFDTIKAEAVEQAKQIKKASASYTAVILEDHEPNPVCTTFGEHQPGQATHYVKVNVKTEENVVIFQSFEGKTDLTKLHTTTAPYGTNVVEFLNGLGLDLDVAGYTLDTAEDGNTNWYKKDSPKWTFGANDTINGWTNVLLKYTITPHNIYAFARLNSYFAPLTTKEFDTPITLNEATLSRLGLGSYNSLGYISIGSFTFDAMPLTGDLYFGDDAELSAVAEKLATDIALETGVSDKIAEKIAWTALYKTVNEEDMAPGYPAEAGYQLSGNLNLASVTFRAGAENVENMPAVNYTYDDGAIDFYDFYFAGDTFTMPADPTREGYIFEGWSVKVLPAENDADHLDADGADDAADETLLKAGDTYIITAGGVVFTAQWEARTDTPYTVEHYLENLDGSYALDTTEPLKGTTDTTVTAAAKSYDNFTYDSTVPGTVASGNIAGDGSLVLKLFYTRNTYDYTVRHIKQLPDGTYDEANAEVENLSGKFEALAAVTAKDYGSHYPTNDADTKQNIKIEKNLTIDVKYDLDNHTLTFETNGGSAIDPVTVRHGNAVARPADPTKDKYTFIGWYVDPEFTEEYDFATVLEADKTIYAKFELTSTPIGDIYVRYDVLHIKQLPDGSYDLANAEVEHLSAKKDTTVTAVVKDYRATHHINVNSTLSKLTDTAIQPYPGADGKPVYTILSVYYDLDFHTLTFDTMGGSRIDPVTVRHGNAVAKPKDPVNGGYIFDGWYTDKTYRTPYNFATVLTQDTTIYAKWFLIALPGVTIKKATPKLNTSDHFAYVQGYPDGTVKPTGNITRAETAAILFRLMDEGSRKTYYSTKSGFRDVATGSWYNTYVATLNNAGVITDSSNGYFRPNEAITRAELAAMLANFTETAGAANYFNDVSARYWAANAIAICAKLGWITGYPDGSFRPDRNVTRAELMAMINRATGRAPKSADAFLPGMKTWSDNTADKWYYLDVQEATNSHAYTVRGSEAWTALTADPNWSKYE